LFVKNGLIIIAALVKFGVFNIGLSYGSMFILCRISCYSILHNANDERSEHYSWVIVSKRLSFSEYTMEKSSNITCHNLAPVLT